VPAMRPFLQLKSLDSVSLKRETITLSDIELVTDKTIKVYSQFAMLILDGRSRDPSVESHSK